MRRLDLQDKLQSQSLLREDLQGLPVVRTLQTEIISPSDVVFHKNQSASLRSARKKVTIAF